ncbi:unnamed protein product [Ixodes persulcatus]
MLGAQSCPMSSSCTFLVLPIYGLRPQAALGAKSMQGGRLRPLPGCPCPSEQRAGSVVRIMPCTGAVQCNVRPQRATPLPAFPLGPFFFSVHFCVCPNDPVHSDVEPPNAASPFISSSHCQEAH